MPVSHVPNPADQPMKANDLGVRLPLGPPDGRALVALAAPVIPLIPIQTPPTSPARSSRFVDASPEFDPVSSYEEPDHQASLGTSVGRSPLRPKWWAKTLVDLCDDELIDGRTTRKKSKPTESVNFALMANIHCVFEPQTYSEAKGFPEWEQVITSKHQSLLKNNTWVISDLSSGKKLIGCKWVYKIKYKLDGSLDKYKDCLVVKDFSQRQGIDYEETFAPTAKMSTIRLVLAMGAQFGWKVHQMDVKSAFMNGDLHEEVYMTQPLGFKVAGKVHQVLKLVKALYGLKQAPWAWYIKMISTSSDQGFKRSSSDSNLYIKTTDNEIILLVIYVDDLIITGNSASLIQGIK